MCVVLYFISFDIVQDINRFILKDNLKHKQDESTENVKLKLNSSRVSILREASNNLMIQIN